MKPLLLAAVLAATAFASVAWTGLVYPHDAMPTAAQPEGWKYPFSCCSSTDCRRVPKEAISERPEGYVINGTGEVIPMTDTRVRRSPDGEWHWCSVAGAEDSRTICLFAPMGGS